MKRLLSFILAGIFLFAVVSCVGNENPAEEALFALKRFELKAFSMCMTADSEGVLSEICEKAAMLTDEKRTVLTSLYGLLHYTVGEEELKDDQKMVTVKASCPDFARVRTLAEKTILVTAQTATEAVSSMLESGEIAANYMLDRTWKIVLKKEADAWKIAYHDKANEAFLRDLYLSELVTFFAQN